ncbi:MAG TPA: energy transducer TonB [Bacteroidales bacterium]|nr:energy transducer TonB [Bacteroidales bacterium]HPD23169.1 energy transducer TonB [Bacteroidales bacterium]HRS99098.1 energy transducer TonB [Bacteroidales bacterium]HRT80693.1 energy transducer TonB [Bacteroidales bacterium]
MELKKSPKADLERRKFIFLEIGLILSLAICYIAFEWKSEELSTSSLGELTSQDIFDEEIINTQQETPPEQPKPEQPEPEAVIEELIVVDDDKVVENLNIDTEADEKTKTNINIVQTTFNVETEEEVEPISFAVVEEKPTFPGGEAELLKFIAENTKYPEIAKENGIQGRVFVQFVIDKNGNVTNVTIARGVDPYLDAEAIRVVKMLPKWTPGKQRGKPVPVTFVVPINFKLY